MPENVQNEMYAEVKQRTEVAMKQAEAVEKINELTHDIMEILLRQISLP